MLRKRLEAPLAIGSWLLAMAFGLLALSALTSCVHGQQHPKADPIKDNSFLIEEAYNQDAGVVQHIYTFSRPMSGSDWAFSFSQEWPVRGMRHQVSYTVPMLRTGAGLLASEGVGDISLQYRYQLLGVDGGPLYVAPRAALVLATGDVTRGRGIGGSSTQLALPVSLELNPSFTVHGNLGLTHTPHAQNELHDRASLTSYNAGASFVWSPSSTFNVLLESTWATTASVIANDLIVRERQTQIAPGIRWAYNLPGGIQIVPGLAYVVGPTRNQKSLFIYLSIEHPFTRQHSESRSLPTEPTN